MAASLKRVKVAPKGMGLNDFVAMQEGYFAAEGLDVEFDWKTFRGHAIELEGSGIFPAAAGPSLHRRQAGCRAGRVPLGHNLQRQRRHGPRRHRRLRRFTLGNLRSAGVENPQAGRSERHSDLGRHARGTAISMCPIGWKNICRSNTSRPSTPAGFGARLKALLDGEVEAASLLPPQIAMAEQLGLAQNHRGSVQDVVVGAGQRDTGGRARLHARTQPRRTGAGGRPAEISAAVEARGPGRIREFTTPGISASLGAANDSSISRCRARSSTKSSRRSSAGASINISRTAARRRCPFRFESESARPTPPRFSRSALHRRVIAREHGLGQELLRVHGPELADLVDRS